MDFEFYTCEMLTDIREYIDNNIEYTAYDTLDDLREHLNDVLWDDDNVTGNASGSYYFDKNKAKEQFLEDGIDHFENVVDAFGIDHNEVIKHLFNCDWNWFDVSVRCYLLPECIDAVLSDIEEDFEDAHGNYSSDDVNVDIDDEEYDEGF